MGEGGFETNKRSSCLKVLKAREKNIKTLCLEGGMGVGGLMSKMVDVVVHVCC